MKKLKLILFTLISIISLPILASAASGTVSVSGTSTVVVGNKVTLTVNLSSNVAIGSWEMELDYDKSYLQLTSTDTESKGVRMANSSATGVKSKKYTFTFKTLKKGSTTVKVDMYDAYAFSDLSNMSLTSSGKTLKIITQEELEASYSKDNNLKELSVEGYTINPEFNKDVTSYNVTVPEGTKNINVIATPSDSKSSITGNGNIEVSEGTNNITIVVRAENGSEKTYNLVVEVIDEHPINVTVGNNNYTVIKLRENYECPSLYTESEIEINDIKIPACVNDKTKYTLVGLKDSEGNANSFIYDNGKYLPYEEVTGNSLKLILLDYDNDLKGLTKAKAKINGITYDLLKYADNNNFYIVYGMNVATGKKDFYIYDTINQTLALYNTSQIDDLNRLNQTYLYVIIAFGSALFLSIICIISLSKKNKKPKIKNDNNNDNIVKEENINKNKKEEKKNKKDKKKKEKKKVEEVKDNKEEENKEEEVKEEEFYNILGD